MSDDQQRFDLAYQSGQAPWETGRPQTAVMQLAQQGLLPGPVLELGCGTGTTSIYLAECGCDIVGVDFSSVAIAQAKARAGPHSTARFFQADILALLPGLFPAQTLLDIGCLQVLPREDHQRYLACCKRLLPRGGSFCLMCFSDSAPAQYQHRFSRQELIELFGSEWQVLEIQSTRFDAPLSGASSAAPAAWLLTARKLL